MRAQVLTLPERRSHAPTHIRAQKALVRDRVSPPRVLFRAIDHADISDLCPFISFFAVETRALGDGLNEASGGNRWAGRGCSPIRRLG